MKGIPVLVIGLAALLLLAAGVAAALSRRPISQPIAYNHQLHVSDVGLECVDCHRTARSGVRATIPNIEICSECHEEQQTDSREEAKLVQYIQEGVKVPWRKIYRVPDNVYFSHRRHTEIAEIECATCHGNIGERQRPVVRRLRPIKMAICIDCHEKRGAPNDCVLCHR